MAFSIVASLYTDVSIGFKSYQGIKGADWAGLKRRLQAKNRLKKGGEPILPAQSHSFCSAEARGRSLHQDCPRRQQVQNPSVGDAKTESEISPLPGQMRSSQQDRTPRVL